MYSGLIYATSLPAAVDALKIPLLKRFQSCEVDETGISKTRTYYEIYIDLYSNHSAIVT
jgi:hypothetical protein